MLIDSDVPEDFFSASGAFLSDVAVEAGEAVLALPRLGDAEVPVGVLGTMLVLAAAAAFATGVVAAADGTLVSVALVAAGLVSGAGGGGTIAAFGAIAGFSTDVAVATFVSAGVVACEVEDATGAVAVGAGVAGTSGAVGIFTVCTGVMGDGAAGGAVTTCGVTGVDAVLAGTCGAGGFTCAAGTAVTDVAVGCGIVGADVGAFVSAPSFLVMPMPVRSVLRACSSDTGLVSTRLAPNRKALGTPALPSTMAMAIEFLLRLDARALLNTCVAFWALSQSTINTSKRCAGKRLRANGGSLECSNETSSSSRIWEIA